MIEANGNAGYPSNKGGASGGGGGGYIHIQADTIIGNIQCSVQGGNGGDNRSSKDLGQFAPGGGGGGGIIVTNTSRNAFSLKPNFNGGKKVYAHNLLIHLEHKTDILELYIQVLINLT